MCKCVTNKQRQELCNDLKAIYKADSLVFDGTNYVNTGIKLFSEENINKDFEINFEIVRCVNGGKYMSIVDDGDTEKYNGMEVSTSAGNFLVMAQMNSEGYWYTYTKKDLSAENSFKVKIFSLSKGLEIVDNIRLIRIKRERL